MLILTLSGSLRAGSVNTALLAAAPLLAPEGLRLVRGRFDALPPFSPDRDREPADPAVAAFRAALARADGVLAASPEYGHGVPGAFKNALDWVTGSGELAFKPVQLLHTSPGSMHAQAHLRESLATLSARLLEDVALSASLRGRDLDPAALAIDPVAAPALRQALAALAAAIRDGRAVA